MATYCVFIPEGAVSGASLADAPVLVREGFSLSAAIFGPLWCIWRRSWIALILWLIGAAGLFLIAYFWRLPAPMIAGLAAILLFLFGLEANALRGAALERRRMRFTDVVVAPSREVAERQFFDRRITAERVGAGRSAAVAGYRPMVSGLGLFPDAEG